MSSPLSRSTGRRPLNATSNQTKDDTGAGSLGVILVTPQYDIMIKRLSIAGPASTIARVYSGGSVNNAAFRAVSYFGQLDDADFPEGMLCASGDNLYVVWYSIVSPNSILSPGNLTGQAPGVATASGEYDV